MLCARCGTHEGVKEYDDMLLCKYCYTIKTTTERIMNTNDRFKIKKLVESIYDEGFNDGYSQCLEDNT